MEVVLDGRPTSGRITQSEIRSISQISILRSNWGLMGLQTETKHWSTRHGRALQCFVHRQWPRLVPEGHIGTIGLLRLRIAADEDLDSGLSIMIHDGNYRGQKGKALIQGEDTRSGQRHGKCGEHLRYVFQSHALISKRMGQLEQKGAHDERICSSSHFGASYCRARPPLRVSRWSVHSKKKSMSLRSTSRCSLLCFFQEPKASWLILVIVRLFGNMSVIGSLIFCTDCGNLLRESTGDANAILHCTVCGTRNKGM